jgi:hypothetical protein
MAPGELTLFWMARGNLTAEYRGLYGWGVTISGVTTDNSGESHISVTYLERWIHTEDNKHKVQEAQRRAAIPGAEVLSLESWATHPLATVHRGTNFALSTEQLSELCDRLVKPQFPGTRLPRAIQMDQSGQFIEPKTFKPLDIVGR